MRRRYAITVSKRRLVIAQPLTPRGWLALGAALAGAVLAACGLLQGGAP